MTLDENIEQTPFHDDLEEDHKIAGLRCEKYGGPSDNVAEEMVYWSDIPEDSKVSSPFRDPNKFLTFEPDHGGWNNIRMAMETGELVDTITICDFVGSYTFVF